MYMKPIFVHIPKTGGTTVRNLFIGPGFPVCNFYYRHVSDHQNLCSNSADIFDRRNEEKYKSLPIVMIARDPFKRAVSEYNFISHRKGFLDRLDTIPQNFDEYMKDPRTSNGIVKFLSGKPLFDATSDEELQELTDKILYAVTHYNFIIGMTDRMNDTLNIINEKLTDIPVPGDIHNERVGICTSTETLTDQFMLLNKFDYKIFKIFEENFKNNVNSIKNYRQFSFTGNRYDYLPTFLLRHTIMDPFKPCPIFMKENCKKLDIIHNICASYKADPKEYVINWVKYFTKTFDISVDINVDDPLDTVKELARITTIIYKEDSPSSPSPDL